MKFLCLAYGDAKDWNALSKQQQNQLSEQDAALRRRGALMGAVEPNVVTVTAWNGVPESINRAYADPKTPLAGFSVIEASTVEEATQLVAGTPCARAKGAIEIRPILAINNYKISQD